MVSYINTYKHTYPVFLVVAAKEFQHLGLLLRLRHPQHALLDTPVLARVFVADLLRSIEHGRDGALVAFTQHKSTKNQSLAWEESRGDTGTGRHGWGGGGDGGGTGGYIQVPSRDTRRVSGQAVHRYDVIVMSK